MVKILGALMTGFACAYLGMRMRMTLRCRADNLEALVSSFEALEGEIHFGMNRLKKALSRADRNGLFALAAEKLEKSGAEEAWRNAVTAMSDKLCLTGADCEALLLLGRSIGKTDSEDQIKNIRYVKSLISAQSAAAREEYRRRAKLCSSGGLLIGALAVIILI